MPPSWAGLVLAMALAAVYGNSFEGEFLFDDLPSIVNNHSIRSLWPIGRVLVPPRDGSTVEARPLVNLSLALNYSWGGLNERGYHAFNLLVHWLAALTLFAVVRRTVLLAHGWESLRPSATGIALAIALVWALHPLQTEAVAYIVQRAESMMGLCYLLTLYCAIRSATSAVAWRWNAAAIVACAAGMASKEVMVSAPLIVVLYDRAFLYRSFADALAQRKGLYAGLSATWLLLLVLVLPSLTRSGSAGWGQGIHPWEYLLTQAGAIVRYLRLSFWPDRLVLDYGTAVIRDPLQVAPQAILVLLLMAATLWSWRRYRWAGFLGTWFFAALAPTSSIVPIVTQTVAEHRMYLPLVPLTALVAGACCLAWRSICRRCSGQRESNHVERPWMGALFVAVVALLLGLRTHLRNEDYRTQFSAWEATMRDWPANQRPRLGMADRLMAQGEVGGAIEKYTEALRWTPDDAGILNSRGVAFLQLGQYEAAAGDYTRAIELKPDYLAYNNRGVANRCLGRLQQALDDHSKAIELNPDFAEAYYGRGIVRRLSGQTELARVDFSRAIELEEGMAQAHHDRAALDQATGQMQDALAGYTRAIELAPGNPLPLVNRGSVLQQTGLLEAAVADYTGALRLDPRDGQTLLNRAACYLALGQYQRAMADLTQARRYGATPEPDFARRLQQEVEGGGSQQVPVAGESTGSGPAAQGRQ